MNKLVVIAVLVAMLFSSCLGNTAPSSSSPSVSMASSANSLSTSSINERAHVAESQLSLYSIVYFEPQSGYTVISSYLLDTLFIAGALYYDFDSANLCPSSNSVHDFSDVEAYFSVYKSHPFIEEFSKYTNDIMQDINGDAVQPLVHYILTGDTPNQWSGALFASAEDVNVFINDLKQFYNDTEAEIFLKNNAKRQEMLEYIGKAAPEIPIALYLSKMEAYVGNKDVLYGNSNLHYYCLTSPFRPAMASFYSCNIGNDIYFVAQTTPYSFIDGTLDMRQILETSIHENLHLFLNSAIAEKSELIATLAQSLNPADFTSQMYAGMPWHRIVDEAIVRAVQAGIYRQVYNDSERAYNELLVKEIGAGMANLDRMYEALLLYESDRSTYPSIDYYLDTLIHEYLHSN